MQSQQILQALQDEVRAAKQNFDQASDHFDAVMRDNLPDRVQRTQASQALSCAGQQLADAHVRLNQFVVQGITPENLRKNVRREGTSCENKTKAAGES